MRDLEIEEVLDTSTALLTPQLDLHQYMNVVLTLLVRHLYSKMNLLKHWCHSHWKFSIDENLVVIFCQIAKFSAILIADWWLVPLM